MSAFGFDPEQLFRPRRPRPRTVRPSLRGHRGRWIAAGVVVLLILLGLLARWLLGLRADYLYYKSLGHTNVFWTPFIAEVVLFILGFLITGGLVGASVVGWRLAARNIDRLGARIATWSGAGIAVIAGIAGGAALAGDWQQVLLWLHTQPFHATDPVFGADYSFFIFTLPVIDQVSALLWAGVIVGLLGTLGVGLVAFLVDTAPAEVALPFHPPEGRTARDGVRVAVRHVGICLAAIFVLAAAGAHFGVYHMATSAHDNFVGLDATQRNVVRPVLGALQVIALILAVATVALVALRWKRAQLGTAGLFGGLLFAWLIGAGLAQGIPAAIYQGTTVNPDAQQAQAPAMRDFLATSRYAWDLEDSGSDPEVQSRSFGTPHAPTLQDLLADIGTLRNVRIQDTTQLPDALAQIDRSRSYQTYPTITVDRYPDPSNGGDTEVMIGPREIAEGDIPNASFVNSALNYTHGYGITAVSVNQVGDEGKPQVLVGQQPMQRVSSSAPPDLDFDGHSAADPRIYCGLSTTQAVVTGTQQPEFDYPAGAGDATTSAGPDEQGIAITNPVDKLALSVEDFGGLNLFLNNLLTPSSRVLVHREVSDRVTSLAPFLTVDGDPYIVVDPQTNHLEWIVDAYVKTGLFPEAYQLQSDGTSYMRNAVKAVIDARTCGITLYAMDLSEPITAAWNAIYPGLLTPFDQMPMFLRSHLRYPEDLFTAQAEAYSVVHVHDPAVLFNGSDRYQVAQEQLNGQNQPTQAYYVEATLPGDKAPSFVLLQTFSPGTSGSGTAANNMTAWLAAQCDYTTTNHPKLISVRLNNSDNVLGPLQFDNNINTDPTISSQKTLLSQQGSTVVLGNVIVLPFNNDSFLYVRPFYVIAASSGGNTAFPQLRYVIVGTQNAVAEGSSFASALQTLYNTTQPIPGLQGSTTPTPTPSTTTPPPSGTVSQQIITLVNQLVQDELAAQNDLKAGNFTAFGQEEDAISQIIAQLKQLLATAPTPSPSPAASPSASASAVASPSPSP